MALAETEIFGRKPKLGPFGSSLHFHNLIMLCLVKQFGTTDLKILRYLDTVTPLYEESVTEETNLPEVSNMCSSVDLKPMRLFATS